METIGFIMAPAKTPAAPIGRLNGYIVRIMSESDVKDRLAGGGSEAVSGTPEELMEKLKTDDARMRRLFKAIGIAPDR